MLGAGRPCPKCGAAVAGDALFCSGCCAETASPETQPPPSSPGSVGEHKDLGLQPQAPGVQRAAAGHGPMAGGTSILKFVGIALGGFIALAILIGIISIGPANNPETGTSSVAIRVAAPTARPTLAAVGAVPGPMAPESLATAVTSSPALTATTRPPTPTRTPPPRATPVIFQVGTEENPYPEGSIVQMGDVRWEVLSVSSRKSLPASFGGERTARGRYVVVSIEVENLGGGKRSVTNPHLLDDEGRVFVSSNDVFQVKPDQIFLIEYLSPNLPFQYTDVYDVPYAANGLMMQVSNLENVPKLAYLSLGEPR